MRPQPAKIAGSRTAQRLNNLRRAFEVVAIGGERMPRGPRFRRQHVEEPIDQRAIVGSHVRDRASAAIIRAVKSRPVRSSPAVAWYMCAGGRRSKLGVWKPVPASTSTVPA